MKPLCVVADIDGACLVIELYDQITGGFGRPEGPQGIQTGFLTSQNMDIQNQHILFYYFTDFQELFLPVSKSHIGVVL